MLKIKKQVSRALGVLVTAAMLGAGALVGASPAMAEDVAAVAAPVLDESQVIHGPMVNQFPSSLQAGTRYTGVTDDLKVKLFRSVEEAQKDSPVFTMPAFGGGVLGPITNIKGQCMTAKQDKTVVWGVCDGSLQQQFRSVGGYPSGLTFEVKLTESDRYTAVHTDQVANRLGLAYSNVVFTINVYNPSMMQPGSGWSEGGDSDVARVALSAPVGGQEIDPRKVTVQGTAQPDSDVVITDRVSGRVLYEGRTDAQGNITFVDVVFPSDLADGPLSMAVTVAGRSARVDVNVVRSVTEDDRAIAKVSLKDAADEARTAINKMTKLTTTQNTNAIGAVDTAFSTGTDRINTASTWAEMVEAESAAKRDMFGAVKGAAPTELDAYAQSVLDQIKAVTDVTTGSVAEAKSAVEQALRDAQAAVTAAGTVAKVSDAVTVGEGLMDAALTKLKGESEQSGFEKSKEATKKSLADDAAEAIKAINKMGQLTQPEKDVEIGKVNAALLSGQSEIDAASTAAGVTSAVNAAKTKMRVAVKNAAHKELDAYSKVVEGRIDGVVGATPGSKADAKRVVQEALAAADAAVDLGGTVVKVSDEVVAGEAAMDKALNDLVKDTVKKGLEDAGAEAKKEINDLPNLSGQEKEDWGKDIDREVDKGKDAIDKSKTPEEAEDAGSSAKDKIKDVVDKAKLADAKAAAIKALEAKAVALEDLINRLPNVSQEAKDQAKKEILDFKTDAIAKVNAAKTPGEVTTARDKGLSNMQGVYDGLVAKGVANLKDAKDKAKGDLDSAADAAKKKIDKLDELSPAEKSVEKGKIDKARDDGKKAIDGVGTTEDVVKEEAKAESEIDKVVDDATLVDAKRAAVKELKAKAQAVEDAIDGLANVTPAEKLAAKQAVDRELTDALNNVDTATSPDAVKKAAQDGKDAMDKIYYDLAAKNDSNLAKAKEKAKSDLEAIANDAIKEIKNLPELSDEDKTQAEKDITKELEKGLGKIDDSKTAGEVESEKSKSEGAINEILDDAKLADAKLAAIKELEAKAAAVKKDIDKLVTVTPAEKAKAKGDIDKVLAGAIGKVNAAKTFDKVKDEVKAGKIAMDDIYYGLVGAGEANLKKAKDQALSDLDKAAAEAKAKIDALPELGDAAKTTAKGKVDSALAVGKAAVGSAKTTGEVADAISDAKSAMNKVVDDATLADAKLAGIKELTKKATDVKKAIDGLANVTKADKDAAKSAVEKALEDATLAVNRAATIDRVKPAVDAGKAVMDAILNGIVAQDNKNLEDEKEKAKDELEKEGESAKNEVEKQPELTPDEKEKKKDEIDDAVKDGKDGIDGAKNPEDITKEKDKAEKEIDGLVDDAKLLNAKRAGIKELEAKAKSVTDSIGKLLDVSKADRDKAMADVAAALKDAKAKVNAAKTVDAVTKAVADGKKKMDDILNSLVSVSKKAPDAPKLDASNGTKVSGTAALGTTIKVKNSKGVVICTTVADKSTGKFSCPLNPVLGNGVVLSVTATNAAGLESKASTVTVKNSKAITPQDGPKTEKQKQLALCAVPRKVAVFSDTPLTHKFYKEIDWMACMKYSTGWRQAEGKPQYKPTLNLERQAMAAFIYRMEAPKNYQAPRVSPFADVKTTDSFYKEIAWMYTEGLSTGWNDPTGKPKFRPHATLSREAMAAFIYRLDASTNEKTLNYKAPKVSPMNDMAPGMKFYKEISWMYDVNLSTGNRTVNGKEFWPKAELSRQAMAAFIYRLETRYRK